MDSSSPRNPAIKICGITRIEDAEQALAAGATMLGFVMVRQSPRAIRLETARTIIKALPQETSTVAVVGTIAPIQALQLVRDLGITHIQLCGSAQPTDFSDFPVRLLRRIPVDSTGIAICEAWAEEATAFVLDHPSGMGGTGQIVDLALAAEIARQFPCLLAGGLQPENVAQAITAVQPLGVDASSGLERAPGIKDADRVTRFVQQARDAFVDFWPPPIGF